MSRCVIISILKLLALSSLVSAQDYAGQDYVGAAKHFVTELSQRHFDDASKQFDGDMARALPPKTLEETWNGLLGQVGDFKQIITTRIQEMQGYQVVFVTCEFVKANLDVKVAFDSKVRIGGLYFVPAQNSSAWSPPAYVQRARIREQSVTVGNNPWRLPGVLTLPRSGNGPFPGIVLVHGSGPLDADETIGPNGANKPFKDLAWGLASQGIVVLRYKKRTLVHGAELKKKIPLFTIRDETMDDAQAAVNLLLRTPAVDPKRVYVIGHSLGGMLAPRIAATNAEISGIVILAGPSRPIEQCLVDQTKYLVKLSGMNSEEAERQVENVQKIANQIEDPNLKPESIVDLMGTHIPGSYWLDLRNYNAVESAARLSTPILVLQGGRDYEVSEANFEGWKTALDGHANISFKLYPNLNHLFIAGSGVSTPAEYNQPGHVTQEVIDDISEWITKQVSK